MSQSDYITHKKMKHVLKDEVNLGAIVDAQVFTNIKRYVLPNKIVNSNIAYNDIVPENQQSVFGMKMNVKNCPSYDLCTNIRNRKNRSERLLPMFSHYRKNPSKDGYFWNQKTKEMLCLEKEFKECDTHFYRRRIWFKKEAN